MADRTLIEWADSTWNPWIGCTKISPACDHCYASAWDQRFAVSGHAMRWGAGQERTRTAASNWKKPVQWNKRRFLECSQCGWRGEARECSAGYGAQCPLCGSAQTFPARRRVFCGSLCDIFDNEVPAAWRADVFDVIHATPHLDWLLLSKRVGNAQRMLESTTMYSSWPHNVWLGSTVCTQEEADRDIPKLLAVPARVRFLSLEPMLEPVTVFSIDGPVDVPDGLTSPLHWIVCGGESGPHARPLHPDWVRGLRDQCASAGVPFMFKQWGAWMPMLGHAQGVRVTGAKHTHPDGVIMGRTGMKSRLLEGQIHHQFPRGES